MGDFVLTPNPNWPADRKPDPAGVACHDRSPFLTIRCSCSYELHVHQTQIAHIPDDAEIVTRCQQCGAPLIFDAAWLKKALREAWGL